MHVEHLQLPSQVPVSSTARKVVVRPQCSLGTRNTGREKRKNRCQQAYTLKVLWVPAAYATEAILTYVLRQQGDHL